MPDPKQPSKGAAVAAAVKGKVSSAASAVKAAVKSPAPDPQAVKAQRELAKKVENFKADYKKVIHILLSDKPGHSWNASLDDAGLKSHSSYKKLQALGVKMNDSLKTMEVFEKQINWRNYEQLNKQVHAIVKELIAVKSSKDLPATKEVEKEIKKPLNEDYIQPFMKLGAFLDGNEEVVKAIDRKELQQIEKHLGIA